MPKKKADPHPTLKQSFSSLDETTKNILADVESPLQLGLLTLHLALQLDEEYLAVEDIVTVLEGAGVSADPISLMRAFARAGKRVHRKQIRDQTHYKIMTRGRRDVEPLLNQGNIELVYIEGHKPRSSRQKLQDILGKLTGNIYISDPYYGVRTLEMLEAIPEECDVHFLTAKTNEKQARLDGPLKDFKKERPKTLIRLYPRQSELHDRYVLTEDQILLIGHGLKDIGAKESFIIRIEKNLMPDLHANVKSAFEARWSIGILI